MGQVRKDNMTDPIISTHIFPNTGSRKTDLKAFGKPGILVIVTSKQDSGRLYKMDPVYECSRRNLGQFTVQRKLSLDEALILLSAHLQLRAYNPEKIKYGVWVRIVCRALSDIHIMRIYAAERKELIKIFGNTFS
jgi:hypothetical protein